MKIVAIISGGLDSATMLYKLLNEGNEVHALTFDYGQKHKKELKAAYILTSGLGLPHKIVNIDQIKELIQGSALTSDSINVPEGHYEEESMKATVVPNRNMIFLSLAMGYAISIGAEAVAYAAHAGDHAIYPDCREVFVDSMRVVAKLCDYKPIQILTPYLHKDKGDIVADGIKLGVPFNNTWTCYAGREKACGKCGACQERLEAFKKNNIKDPLIYEEDE